MSTLRGWWIRIKRSLRPGAFDAEMEDEMRAHQELEALRLAQNGTDGVSARREAALAFGSIETHKERVRDRRFAQCLHEFVADARYGLRQLRNAPGFTTVAIATLALGIGATTAMFSALDGVMFRPMPYANQDRVVLVFEVLPGNQINNASGGAFIDWRTHQTAFEAISLTSDVSQNGRYRNTLERLSGTEVTHEFFRVLSIKAIVGRTFLHTEDQPGGENRVVVISEDYWRSRCGSSPDVIGQTLVLDEISHTIVGVVPRDFIRPETQYYVPAVALPAAEGKYSRNLHWAVVVGRLKQGVTLAEAEGQLRAIKERLSSEYPVWKKDWSVAVRLPRPLIAEQTGPLVVLLVGAVSLVLLIACANVANLLLARATQREREMALRTALGATTGRLVRQVLTESLLLSLAGAAAGILLAWWIIDLLRTATATNLPPALAPQLDVRVVLAAVGVALFTSVLFGLFPALKTRRSNTNDALNNGGRTGTARVRNRTQAALIIGEVAMTVVLLTTAGLLTRSLQQAVASDPGFEPQRALAFDLSLPDATYDTPEKRFAFANQLRDRLLEIPGVENAGTGMSIPFAGGGFGEKMMRSDQPSTWADPGGRLDYVSPGYLESLGARLLQGRWISADDNRPTAAKVIVVNEAVAKRFFKDEDPTGNGLRVNGEVYKIIGVIANIPDRNKDAPSPLFGYVPQAFNPSTFSVVIRTKSSPQTIVPAVREALRSLDSGLPMANARTLDQAMHASLRLRRTVLGLIGGFATASLLLACIGLYGVMAYSVATRRRELSIRMALGAERANVLTMVMREGLRLVAIGAGIGLVGAMLAGHSLRSQLYAVSSYDPAVLCGSLLALAIVAALACWIPACRATRSDALSVLRTD